MYGPPPDPRQIAAPIGLSEDMGAYAACLLVGVALSLVAAWRRPPTWARALLIMLGQTVVLTMPLAAHLDEYVFGSFPTIDKEGSLLFYLDGVHLRMLLHPVASLADPAARLIGVHVGHLWVTALFDIALSPVGAMNAQALLYPVLAWFSAWLLLRDVCRDAGVALVIAFPFGLGLHLFRDLNWYTIEKAAVFWLVLFVWALHRGWQRGGRWHLVAAALFALTTWMNVYLGLVGGAMAGTALVVVGVAALRRPELRVDLGRLAVACGASVLAVTPLAAWQVGLMTGGPGLGTPEQFLAERAALDGFTLVPPAWNRLEILRVLQPVVLLLSVVGAVRGWREGRVKVGLAVAAALFVLSLGPVLVAGPDPLDPLTDAVVNPAYMGLHRLVPGFWRIAKPEVFFHGTWLVLCGLAAMEAARWPLGRRWLALAYVLFVATWLVSVRLHPVYPGMSMPIEGKLSDGWQERVFGQP